MKTRIIKTLTASSFGQLVTIFSQIALVPMFISVFGVVPYGEWLLISSIPVYLSMSDAGLTEYYNNRSSICFSEGDINGALKNFNTGFFGVILISFAILIFAVSIFNIAIQYQLFDFEVIGNEKASLVFTFLAIYAVLCCLSTYIESTYRVELNYHRGIFIVNGIRIFELIASMFAIFIFESFLVLSVFLMVCRLFGVIFIFMDLRKVTNFISVSLNLFSKTMLVKDLRESSTFALFPISLMLTSNGVSTIVGVVSGPASLVLFNCLKTVSRFPFQISNIINSSIWQEASTIYGEKERDMERIIQLQKTSIISSFVLSFFVGVLLFIFIDEIVYHWTDGVVVADSIIFFVLALSVSISSIWFTGSVFLRATNNHVYFIRCHFLLNILFLALFYFFVGFSMQAGLFILAIFDVIVSLVVLSEMIKLNKAKGIIDV